MTSRSGASAAQPWWGSARPAPREARWRPVPVPSRLRVRWGTRGSAAADVAAGAVVLGATAGLWAAFLLSVW